MADVDAFTQRMLDRARQRRENLDKKMAETTPRKRPAVPLSENQQMNIRSGKSSKDDDMDGIRSSETSHGVGKLTVHLSSPQCSRITADHGIDHDSPNKKYCVRLEENDVKPDTPAIQSVRSRLHGLAALRSHDDDRMDSDPPAKPRRAPAPQLDDEDREPKPAARRNRLAALAQTINTWEDDLSRPVIKQEEKPKKIWQPPRATAAPEPAQPSKPPRTFEYAKGSSPSKPKVSEEAATDFMKRIAPARGVSPVKFSPSKAAVDDRSRSKASLVKTSPVKAKFFPSPKPVVSTMTVKLASTPSPAKSSTYGRDDMKKPLSSGVAAWQKKSTEDTPEEPTKQPVSARKATWENKVQATNKNVFKTPTASNNTSKSSHKEPRRDLFDVSMHDPLNMSVHSRMGVWEKKVDESQKEKEEHIKSQQILRKSPVKGPGPRSTADFKNSLIKKAGEVQARNPEASNSVSPMRSPGKIFQLTKPRVGQATKELHARLTKMDANWKNNEIAEKIKQQKEADMAVLQNRWKNGVLNDEGPDEHVSPKKAQSVPAAPPPPPTAAPRRTSPQKSAPKTPKNERREQARDKIRAEPGAVQSLGSLISTEGKNFEQKLCAMGFEVTPSKTATMDLTPIKEKERSAHNHPKSPVRAKPSAVLMEETKITTTRFGNDEKVHVSTKTYPVGNQTSSYNANLRTNGTPAAPSTPSIYNIIKKNSSNNTPRPQMGKLHDSFDSDDSFEDSSRKQMPPPNRVQPPNAKVTVTTTVKRQDSMSSTQSETQSEYSEVTDTQDDYTEDYTEDDESQYSEEDYSSEDESATDNQQLDDLLDEAMDDTEITETETESEVSVPVAPPRRSVKENRPISYHGSTSSKDSRSGSDSSTGNYGHLLRRPNETPAERENRRRRGVTFAEGTTPASSELSSAESEDERPQVYSIDMYRNSWNHIKQQNKVTPKMTIVRHSEHSRRREHEEEPLPYVPEKSVRQKLQELQELVNQEQTVIQQTSNALNQCCGTNSLFAGSAEAVECHRLLLIACKKREAYITEMQHLRDGSSSMLGRQPQGSLTLSDLRLPLKREFMSRIGGPHDTAVHYFICMIRNGAHVVLTQMMSTHDAMVRDSLDFPNLIQLKDIKQNFRFDLEIYGMSVIKEVDVSKTPKKQKKGLTPKKWLKGSTPSRSLQSPAGPTSVRSTNFVLVACLPINIKSVTKTHFSLDKVPYSSPLQGTIHLKLRCLMESSIIEKGFLTIFEDVSGFGAWHRRWFVLKNHTLSFWKYPDDEKIKEPIGYVDLKYCISEKIGLIPRDICARPNTFEILTVRRQQKGERDTLTSWVSNTVSTTRHMLSADTKEDRLAWCERMNEALTNVRSWSPEALRPIKVQAVEDPTKPLGGNKYQHMTNI